MKKGPTMAVVGPTSGPVRTVAAAAGILACLLLLTLSALVGYAGHASAGCHTSTVPS